MSPTRVLVVDDSSLLRTAVRDVLESTSHFEVVGEAASGLEALRKIRNLKPDIVSLDIEMPGMNGLSVLRWVMRTRPTRVVLVSSHTSKGADITLEGLELGAVDFVHKAQSGESFDAFSTRLRATFRTAEQANVPDLPTRHRRPATVAGAPLRQPAIIAVAASTGGPAALGDFLASLENPPPVPILIVQHMPSAFTGRLAQRLDRVGPVGVAEAKSGMQLESGRAIVAAGGSHMVVDGSHVKLDDGPSVGGLKPRADITFRSVASQYGRRTLAVILSGMGNDGLEGARAISRAGGQVLAQDEATAVVDGMPKRVREAGLAARVAPPSSLARMIETSFAAPRRAPALT